MATPTNFHLPTSSAPARAHFQITPSDSINIVGGFRALFCNGAGTISILDYSGTSVTYTVTASQVLPVTGLRVNATGTTVGSIIGWV